MRLSKEVLMNGIGKLIHDTKHKTVGRMADILESKGHEPAFMILSCDSFSGFGSRYFAIPLTDSYIKVSDEGKIILTVKEEDLNKADAVEFDNSSIRNKKILHSIFELLEYHCPLTPSS